MMPFSKYAKVKDNYCACYFGPADEYLVQLRLLGPLVERQFPGVKIYFGCRDDKVHIFGSSDRVMKLSDIKMRRQDFAHIRELRYDGTGHPVEQFMVESDLKNWTVANPPAEDHAARCVIITQGNYPTKNMEQRQIESVRRVYKDKGYDVEIDASVKGAGIVVGVESPGLFEAASQGVQTVLVPTGVGTRLYKLMLPFSSLLHN
jgi:hypothetical protein